MNNLRIKIKTFYKYLLICLGIMLFGSDNLFAQKYKDIVVNIDTSNFYSSNEVYLRVILLKKNGKQILCDYRNPNSKWNKVIVKANLGSYFNNGKLVYQVNQANKDNHLLTITVSDPRYQVVKELKINVPYIKNVVTITKEFIINRKVDFDYYLVYNNGTSTNKNESLMSEKNMELYCDHFVTYENGQVMISGNYLFPSRDIKFTILNRQNKEVLDSTRVHLNYPTDAEYIFNGYDGADGVNGANGSGYSKAGFNGTPGLDAGNGQNVKIYFKFLKDGKDTLLQMFCLSELKNWAGEIVQYNRFMKIKVRSNGGNGGMGGSGGNGADGLVDKNQNIIMPIGGNAGNGAKGGNGGNGGTISLYCDSSSTFAIKNFDIEVAAGKAGEGGRPGKKGIVRFGNAPLLNAIMQNKDGKEGSAGERGQVGKEGPKPNFVTLAKSDFEQQLKEKQEGKY